MLLKPYSPGFPLAKKVPQSSKYFAKNSTNYTKTNYSKKFATFHVKSKLLKNPEIHEKTLFLSSISSFEIESLMFYDPKAFLTARAGFKTSWKSGPWHLANVQQKEEASNCPGLLNWTCC